MICPKCGKDNVGNFCDQCGEKLYNENQADSFSSFNQAHMQGSTSSQPQMQSFGSTQSQETYNSRSTTGLPSTFEIIISGVIPIAGWIMGLVVALSGNGKKGGFYFINGTVCFFLGLLGVGLSYGMGMIGSAIGLGLVAVFLSSRKKKVDSGEISF